MNESIKDTLVKLRQWKSEFEDTARKRIEELQLEKRQMNEEYDAEIDDLETELRFVGADVADRPGSNWNADLAERIFQILCEQEGKWMTSFEINQRVKNSAALTHVLADYIVDGRILKANRSYRAVLLPKPAE